MRAFKRPSLQHRPSPGHCLLVMWLTRQAFPVSEENSLRIDCLRSNCSWSSPPLTCANIYMTAICITSSLYRWHSNWMNSLPGRTRWSFLWHKLHWHCTLWFIELFPKNKKKKKIFRLLINYRVLDKLLQTVQLLQKR